MRVSHSEKSKLNILEILKHFCPISESCRQATSKNMYFIFPMRAIPPVTEPACNYEGMDMHSIATLLCQIWE